MKETACTNQDLSTKW